MIGRTVDFDGDLAIPNKAYGHGCVILEASELRLCFGGYARSKEA